MDLMALLSDRLEAAIQRGDIVLVESDDTTPTLTFASLAAVLQAMIPEHYLHDRPMDSQVCDEPPKSRGRERTYQRRAAAGLELFHPDDASGDDDERGIEVDTPGRNGIVRVQGWVRRG